jgi:hypothetical protein
MATKVGNGFKSLAAGKRFGRLTVLADYERRGPYKEIFWRARCGCGNEVWVRGSHLRNGHTLSCGCLHRERSRERLLGHFRDLSSMQFGGLKVLPRCDGNPRIEQEPHRCRYQWLCKCECGEEVWIRSFRLLNGHTRSCGCLFLELVAKRSTRHGHGSHRGEKRPTSAMWTADVTF